ncbi:MAG: hypothetical protein Q9163_006101, partial [Psora crenata]
IEGTRLKKAKRRGEVQAGGIDAADGRLVGGKPNVIERDFRQNQTRGNDRQVAEQPEEVERVLSKIF